MKQLLLASVAVIALNSEAQGTLDHLVWAPASNAGGTFGSVDIYSTNNQYYPSFLVASASVPNYTGIQVYSDASLTTVRDQLWTQAGHWYFSADPSLVNFSQLGITQVGSVVETHSLQDMSSYFNLAPGSMQLATDVAVPEPASGAILLCCGGLILFRRRLGSHGA